MPPQAIGAMFSGTTLGISTILQSIRCNDSSSHQSLKNPFPKDLHKSFHPGFPLTPASFTPASFTGNPVSHTALRQLWKPCGEPLLYSRPAPLPASSISHLKEPLRTTPRATRNKYKKHKMSEMSL